MCAELSVSEIHVGNDGRQLLGEQTGRLNLAREQ